MRKKIFHSFLTLTCLVLAIFTAVLVLGVYQLEQRQLESSLQSETEMLASVVAGGDDGAAQLERLALDRRVTLVAAWPLTTMPVRRRWKITAGARRSFRRTHRARLPCGGTPARWRRKWCITRSC